MKKWMVMISFLLAIANASAEQLPVETASWHRLAKVTKVTVMEGTFYVKGDDVSGHVCSDLSNYYGTLNHMDTEPGHSEYYSMVLMAQATGKGLTCYVSSVRSNGVCLMKNCHLL